MLKFKILRKLGEYISPASIKKLSGFFKHYMGGLFNRIDEHHLFLLGGGLAFSVFVCIIPFTLIIFSVLGNVLDSSSVEVQVSNFIDMVIPYHSYADYAKRVILSRIPEVIQYKNLAAWLGGFGLLFASSGLFSAMRTVLNKIFGVTQDKNLVIGKLRDFGMVLVLILFIFLSTFVLPILNLLKNITESIEFLEFIHISEMLDSVFSIASFIVVFGMFYFFYYVIPYEKLGRSVPLVAALWATFFWEVARQAFGYYIFNLASISKIYGTYALLVVVAFWIYYCSILFILGAEIGQLYRERKYKLAPPVTDKNNIF